MIKLPFLKNKRMPRIETEAKEPVLVNASASDHLEDHCIGELMNSLETKDVAKFRSAIEALVLNMFDTDGDEDE